MHTRWTKLIALVLVSSRMQAAAGHAVNVCIDDRFTPTHTLDSHKRLVSRIFGNVGIRLAWHDCTEACEATSSYQIRFIDRAPASASATALAFTHVY